MDETPGKHGSGKWLALVTSPLSAGLGAASAALLRGFEGNPLALALLVGAILFVALWLSVNIAVIYVFWREYQTLRAERNLYLERWIGESETARGVIQMAQERAEKAP